MLGLGRTGAIATHRSGDFVIAFSTAQRVPHREQQLTRTLTVLAEDGRAINWLFQAAVEATEEAILNALCMAETMQGRDDHVRHGLPLDRLVELLRTHGHASVRLPQV